MKYTKKNIGKSIAVCTLALFIAIGAFGCALDTGVLDDSQGKPTSGTGDTSATDGVQKDPNATLPNVQASANFSEYDTTISFDSNTATKITLADGASKADGDGAKIDGDVITINRPGTYILSGTLTDGRIIVTVEKVEKVQLVLNNVKVTSSTTAPLYITSADKVSITLPESSVNSFEDANYYDTESVSLGVNACIFSKDDLTVNGYGKLIVTGNYNNGIGTSNDLKIVSGTVEVSAMNNALKGKDSVLINSGTVTVEAGKDGLKSDETDDPAKGLVCIEGGTVIITSIDDAIQAENSIIITGGTVTTYAEGKSYNCKNLDGTVTINDGCLIEK